MKLRDKKGRFIKKPNGVYILLEIGDSKTPFKLRRINNDNTK